MLLMAQQMRSAKQAEMEDKGGMPQKKEEEPEPPKKSGGFFGWGAKEENKVEPETTQMLNMKKIEKESVEFLDQIALTFNFEAED